jgi:signal transduction histidine kinase
MHPLAFCNFGPGNFLVFGPQVGPLQYYSHLPIIAIATGLAGFIYFNNRKSLANQILFGTIITYAVWVFLDSVIWASNESNVIMFAWSLQILMEPLVYIGSLYLLYVLAWQKDTTFLIKSIWALLYLPIVLTAFTHLNLNAFDVANCLATEGLIGHYYSYGLEIFFVLWIVIYSIYSFIKIKGRDEKMKVLYLSIGIFLFLGAFSWGNIIGSFTQNWQIAQYGLFGMPIFTGFLVYSIVRYKTFNIKLIGSVALVVGLIALTFSLLFVNQASVFRQVAFITFLFSIGFGYMLIKSVNHEVKQREHIEELAVDLEKANSKLKQLDQLKSEFLSVASHQLRAPITAIKGYVANILEDSYGSVPEYLREPLGVVQESTRVMTSSIEDYLNVSRIEQGRMKYEMSSVDVTALAKRAVEELTPVAQKKGLSIVFTDSPTLSIEGDFGKIKQVFTNLIDNAIKYTEHGSITVSVVKDDVKKVMRFMSADTGIGIPADEVGKLFSKFTRARDANKVNTTGTGLGLYVAKNLVEGHGGKVWAESDGTGKGSRFIVELPLVQPPQPEEPAKVTPAS